LTLAERRLDACFGRLRRAVTRLSERREPTHQYVSNVLESEHRGGVGDLLSTSV
jgi:hypothetical protein